MNIGTARLFLGLEPSGSVRKALSDVRGELERQELRAKLYDPALYHLTLCFLGSTPTDRIDEICRIMDGISCEPFRLTLSALGTFKNGSILWAGVEECVALREYRARLARALADADFPIEEGEYRPHITMGRQVKSPIPDICVPSVSFCADHAVLFESTRIDGVLTYVPIYRSVFH